MAVIAQRAADINASVGKFTGIVTEITDSAKKQSVGIRQVSSAMAEMDKVTQQNAASAEESSSAAAELAAQSESLAKLVASWQIDHLSASLPDSRRLHTFRALTNVGNAH